MSDIFGVPSRPGPGRGTGFDRRRRVLVPTLVTLAALLFLGSIFTNLWTDRLWFRSVGYGSVFTTVLVTRVGLFVVMGLLFALLVLLNGFIAWRLRPDVLPTRRDDPAFRYRAALAPVARAIILAFGAILALLTGSIGAGHWDVFQLWRHGTSFGSDDAQFGKDVGFFVFTLPWLNFVASFALGIVVLSVLVAVFVHYIVGNIRFGGRGPSLSRGAQVHLLLLVGFGVLIRSFSYWLDRFDYATTPSTLFDGIGYTDAHARIPAHNILVGVAIVCAVLFFAGALMRSWVLPGLSLALLLLTSILIGGIWPFVMQSFQVKPSEPDKEGPYITRNIAATRQAYDVAGTKAQPYSAKTSLTGAELSRSAESRVSSRLLDPTLIAPAFEQLQQVRGYYTMPGTLDVDRYRLAKGQTPQDIIIAARELRLDGLQPTQRNWANDHTAYTHGYGVVAARGNERGAQGAPVWVEKDIPPVGDLKFKIPPRIYFGEFSPDYSIVGRPKGAAPIEVDIPRGDGGSSAGVTQNTYGGTGGVPIGSLFAKSLYAFKFAEPNIILSSRVNSASRILYERHPRDRVQKVAPWLTIDGDPYPAVVDGRVVWIVDGYTTSNNYPYSQHRSLREATADTLTHGLAVLPTDQINYMRNSVKAVVDAYDGSVELYQWDKTDPVLKTWMKVFPGVVKPRSAISKPLLEHLRYPVDLFKVQRDVLKEYHVTDAQTFYKGEERWKVPEDPVVTGVAGSLQPPYYVSVSTPGQKDGPYFSLTTVYLPNSRQNLASFMSVNSEASSKGYGRIDILQLPSDTQVGGPSQIANQFSSDRGVTQALFQFRQSDAKVQNGNLLTLPVGGGLLYVQPVYIKRSAAEGTYPVLQFVAASFGKDVGFGQTLDQALRVALKLQDGDVPSDELDNSETPSTSDGSASGKTTSQYLADASARYSEAQDALKAGDLAGYQRKIDQMNDLIERAQKALK